MEVRYIGDDDHVDGDDDDHHHDDSVFYSWWMLRNVAGYVVVLDSFRWITLHYSQLLKPVDEHTALWDNGDESLMMNDDTDDDDDGDDETDSKNDIA